MKVGIRRGGALELLGGSEGALSELKGKVVTQLRNRWGSLQGNLNLRQLEGVKGMHVCTLYTPTQFSSHSSNQNSQIPRNESGKT